MKIKENFEIIDLSLLVDDILILSDFHLGYEEALNVRGVLMPRFQFEDTMERLGKIFDYLDKEGKKVNKIIIDGDLKHEFGKISETEWSHISQLLDYLKEKCKELIVVQGNHDVILAPIVKKRKIELVDHYFIDKYKTIVLHGDKIPSSLDYHSAETIVMGNEHPAVGLKEEEEGVKLEKCKCFLYGKFDSKDLIVLPSFNLITIGTDVLREKILSPFLKVDLSNFECFVVEDKIYKFGKLKGL